MKKLLMAQLGAEPTVQHFNEIVINLPENEKPEEPALSEEELMEKIVREAKISWEKRKEREELMEIRRKEQIEARRKAREAEEEQESKDEI